MDARLRLGITFGFVSARRMVKLVIDQTWRYTSDTNYAILHQRLRCVTYYGQGYLKVLEGRINTEKYLEVLDECLWPTVQRYFPDGGYSYIFQEDNARTHKANFVKRYFQEKNIIPIPWSMYSPDLSPIDNCSS